MLSEIASIYTRAYIAVANDFTKFFLAWFWINCDFVRVYERVYKLCYTLVYSVYIVDKVSYNNKLNLPQQKQCYPEKICTVMMIEEVEGVQANCIYRVSEK